MTSLSADIDFVLHGKILNPVTRQVFLLQPPHIHQASQECFEPKRLPLRAHSSDLIGLSILKPGLIHQAAEATGVHVGD